MAFIFNRQSLPPTIIYVNKDPISQEMYQRLCDNPSEAIILYGTHHNNDTNKCKISSIYNGYDIETYGISTFFHKLPSLTECQNIWNKQISKLKQLCTDTTIQTSVIIIESNPNTVISSHLFSILHHNQSIPH